MTTQYEGEDIWSETIDHVTDDDTRDASAYTISAIGLADRTRYLKNRGFYSAPAFDDATYTNAGTYRISGQIVFTNVGNLVFTYTTPHGYGCVAGLLAYANTSFWELAYNDAPPKGHYRQSSNLEAQASNSGLVFDFVLPSNCTITRVAVRVDPATHVALPDIKPKIFVYLVDVIAGTTADLGNAEDPSLTLTAYNALHVIDIDLSQVFDASRNRLMVKVFGEDNDANMNALAGLVVHLPIVEFTRLQIGEELGEPLA